MKGDLHTHSTCSDGACAPEQVFRYARQAGLDFLALTDHDYLSPPGRDAGLAKKYGLTALRGVELSTYDYQRKRRVHILCYLPERDGPVEKYCAMVCRNRREAGLEMAALVAEKYPLTVQDVEEDAAGSGAIFKQHILHVLMQMGYADRMYGALWDELFNGRTGSCVRACIQPDVWKVLPELHAAGGVVVMAHPFTYNGIDILKELTAAGLLHGVEVWQSKTTPEQEEFLLGFAKEKGLIPTGGSDFHGAYAPRPAPLGCAPSTGETLKAILRRKDEILKRR